MGSPDCKGHERHRKISQSQTKTRHREEETYITHWHTTAIHGHLILNSVKIDQGKLRLVVKSYFV